MKILTSFLKPLKLYVFIILLVFFLLGCTVPTSNPTIHYSAKVLDHNTDVPISQAKVTIEVSGMVPLIRETDSEGYVVFDIDSSRIEKSGQLLVNADEYIPFTRYVTINESLPSVIRLESSTVTPITVPIPTLEPTSPVSITSTNVPSSTPAPTNTPVPPTATSTYILVAPTLKPTLIQLSATPKPVDLRPIDEITAPILEAPPDDASKRAEFNTTFEWKWDGELLEGQGFEILVWQGDEIHYGAFDAKVVTNQMRFSDNVFQFSGKLEGAHSVTQHGSGEYMWAVAIVNLDPYEHIIESLSRKIELAVGVGGGNGDNQGGGGWPTPAPP